MGVPAEGRGRDPAQEGVERDPECLPSASYQPCFKQQECEAECDGWKRELSGITSSCRVSPSCICPLRKHLLSVCCMPTLRRLIGWFTLCFSDWASLPFLTGLMVWLSSHRPQLFLILRVFLAGACRFFSNKAAGSPKHPPLPLCSGS